MSKPDCPRRPLLPLDVARRLDPICDRFEDDWLAGRRPRLEEFLDRVPPADRLTLLAELLGLELDYRLRRGEHVEAEDYRRRLPGCDEVIEAAFASLSVPGDALSPTFYTSPPRTEVKDTRPDATDATPLPQQAGRG